MGLYNFNGMGRLLNTMQKSSTIQFVQPSSMDLSVNVALDFNANAYKNRIWYRADPYELEQFYQKLVYNGRRGNFWSQTASSEGQEVLKIHSGLPAIMVDTMANVVLSDMRSITFEAVKDTELWEQIARENNFKRLLYKALQDVLVVGDGAFKITYETCLSMYPIIEWYGGDRIDFVYRRGRIMETVFKTEYVKSNKTYTLKERYGYGYIINELYDDKGNKTSLDTVPEVADLRSYSFAGAVIDGDGNVKKRGTYMMAAPLIIYHSSKYEGRGEGIFDKRESGYCAIDEDLSQWMVNLRSAMPKMFINEDLIPKDKSGILMKPNAFDNRFLMTRGGNYENSEPDIKMIQFQIMWEAYFQTHICFLDNVLQGFESPSTIGIDVKKTDNAESQREKEKTTLYTRAAIIDVMGDTLEKLVLAAMNSYYGLNSSSDLCSEPSINFGEYANPSYEAVVETLQKAFTARLISVEWMVEEQWGDTKTPEEKAEEVERIKALLNMGMFEAPDFSGSIDYSDEYEDEDEELTDDKQADEQDTPEEETEV